jgi:hypothetical protein
MAHSPRQSGTAVTRVHRHGARAAGDGARSEAEKDEADALTRDRGASRNKFPAGERRKRRRLPLKSIATNRYQRSYARATRKRLVVDPARMSWMEVAKELLPRSGDVAVSGGQVVFDLFLKIGFDALHLSRACHRSISKFNGVGWRCPRHPLSQSIPGSLKMPWKRVESSTYRRRQRRSSA